MERSEDLGLGLSGHPQSSCRARDAWVLPCLPECVCSVDVEIITASGCPASAKLLQHSPGLWGVPCTQVLCRQSSGQAARFGRSFSGVIGKEFPVAALLGTEEI